MASIFLTRFIVGALFVSAMAVTWDAWYKTRERYWRSIAFVLLLIPLVAPFDDLWHRLFGVENLTSPFVIWSPPHVVGIGSAIGGLLLLLPLIRQDKDIFSKRFFGSLIFAGLLSSLFFL